MNTINRTFKFRGIPSGDIAGDQKYFCFAMPLADAMRNGFYDLAHNCFFSDLVSVSPDRMVTELDAGQMYEFEITIKATPIKEPQEDR